MKEIRQHWKCRKSQLHSLSRLEISQQMVINGINVLFAWFPIVWPGFFPYGNACTLSQFLLLCAYLRVLCILNFATIPLKISASAFARFILCGRNDCLYESQARISSWFIFIFDTFCHELRTVCVCSNVGYFCFANESLYTLALEKQR